jgi:hypothetical protein
VDELSERRRLPGCDTADRRDDPERWLTSLRAAGQEPEPAITRLPALRIYDWAGRCRYGRVPSATSRMRNR